MRHPKKGVAFIIACLAGTAMSSAGVAQTPDQKPITIDVVAFGQPCPKRVDTVCSVPAARDLVRARLREEAARDIDVLLAPGLHQLIETLTFDARDSASSGGKVTWRSRDPTRPAILTSAVEIDDESWRPYRDGIWRAPIPQALYDASLVTTRELDPDAQAPHVAAARTLLTSSGKARRAGIDLNIDRLRDGPIFERKLTSDPVYAPNDNGSLDNEGASLLAKHYVVRPGVLHDGVGDLAAKLAPLQDAHQRVESVTLFSFMRAIMPVDVRATAQGITLAPTPAQWDLLVRGMIGGDWGTFDAPSPDRLENAKVFLDEPGEFFIEFDAEPGVQASRSVAVGDFVYLKTDDGRRPTAVSAPILDKLIIVEGSEQAPVRNLTFADLVFSGTTVRLPVGVTGPGERGYFGIQGTLSFRGPQSDAANSVTWETFNDDYIHDRGFKEEFLASAVEVRFAAGGGFERNRFERLGGSGLALVRGVRGVDRNAPYASSATTSARSPRTA